METAAVRRRRHEVRIGQALSTIDAVLVGMPQGFQRQALRRQCQTGWTVQMCASDSL